MSTPFRPESVENAADLILFLLFAHGGSPLSESTKLNLTAILQQIANQKLERLSDYYAEWRENPYLQAVHEEKWLSPDEYEQLEAWHRARASS